jgi:hypothetical protein
MNCRLSKKFIYLLFCIALFSVQGLHSPLSSLSPYQTKKWTVAVYMNGDNELESSITGGVRYVSNATGVYALKEALNAGVGDFHDELAALGSTDNVHVVALIDRTPGYVRNMDDWTNTRLYYIEKGDYPDNNRGTFWVDMENDEMNMSDSNTLAWFLQTVVSNHH